MKRAHWTDLETFLLAERDLAPTTAKRMLRFARALEREGVNPRRPSRRAFNAFIAGRKRDGRDGPGLRHYVVAIRHCLAWRGRSAEGFSSPRAPTSPRALPSDVTIAALLEYDQGREELETAAARFSLRLGFYCALRPSEHVSLELQDFDAKARTLRVWSDKLDQYHTIDLEPWLAEEIQSYITGLRAKRALSREKALVVDPWTGRAWPSVAAYGMWLGRCGRRVDTRFAPGILRHCGLTWYYLVTGDIYLTKARARHKKLSSTEHYVILARAIVAKRAAAANIQPYQRGALA